MFYFSSLWFPNHLITSNLSSKDDIISSFRILSTVSVTTISKYRFRSLNRRHQDRKDR